MMNNELRPYENYKSIDLPWLNSIPEHWSVSRNKNLMFQAKSLVGGNHNKYKLLSLTLNGVIARDMVNPKGKFPKEFDTYQIVRQKDLVFCLFDIDETPRTVGISPLEGMITGAYTVFNVKNANERYLYYYYLALDNNKMLKPLYTGLRKVVSADTFLRTKLPVPPRSEQDQIVKYLDHQLAKINKFIKAKKKLIAVFKEQIECYVYGNDAEFSEDISSWETSFPKEWKMVKASRLTKERNIKNKGEYELLAVTQDRGVVFKKDCEQNYVSPAGDLSGLKLVSDGDYVISLRSFQGGIEFSNVEGIVSPAYNIFSLVNDYESEEYKHYYKQLFKTKAFISLLNTVVSGIRDGKNINYSDFAKLLLPVPPQNVANKVYKLSLKIDKMQNEFNAEFALLKEFRDALISDVVTGKVDVRNIIIDELEEEILEDIEIDEDSIEESLEAEDGDE